jgi:hypothetical protein
MSRESLVGHAFQPDMPGVDARAKRVRQECLTYEKSRPFLFRKGTAGVFSRGHRGFDPDDVHGHEFCREGKLASFNRSRRIFSNSASFICFDPGGRIAPYIPAYSAQATEFRNGLVVTPKKQENVRLLVTDLNFLGILFSANSSLRMVSPSVGERKINHSRDFLKTRESESPRHGLNRQ